MKISTLVFPIRGDIIYLSTKKVGFGAGFLNGYGGKQNPEDATIADTAIRELREEAGIVASENDLERVAIINFFEEDTQIFECHVFFCHGWTGEMQESDEMALPQPYPLANPPFDKMWHADRTWLPLVCSGNKIRATSRYNKGMTEQVSFEYSLF